MASLRQFFNSVFAAAKRHALVLGGIVGTAVAAAVGTHITNLLTSGGAVLSEKVAETACQYRQNPTTNNSQFIVLVSRLTRDPDRSHTDRVMQAFQNEHGIQAIPICESLSLDYSKNSQNLAAAAKQRAEELIKKNHADLLLFGDVTEQNKAIIIYAVNENGGCDLQPKPTEIKLGVLQSEFTAEEKVKLIEVSLEEIQKACLNQSSRDWPAFAKRMNKMELFLNHFDFSEPKYLYFAGSYIEAMRLLYQNGQGDVWFAKGEKFAKQRIDEHHGSEALSSVYTEYAILLAIKYEKTKDKNDRDAAFSAFDKAISLNPKNVFGYQTYTYQNRGDLFSEKGDLDRAIEDYSKAIGLDPNNARAYSVRGDAYKKKGEWDHAIEDYTKAIDLDPKDAALAYGVRGDAYKKKGDINHAIDDYTKAIGLDPNNAESYELRGEAYSDKGEWDRAIDDFNKAMALDPEYGRNHCYCHRGSAYLRKGDFDRAIEDFTKAIGIDAKYAGFYGGRGDAYRGKHEWDRAIEDYTKAIGLDPKNAGAYEDRGVAYLAKGDRDRAVVDYNKAIGLYGQALQLDAKSAPLWNSRCWARAIAGQLQKALSDCKHSLDLKPNDADIRDSRGFVYLKMGKLEDAIADYNAALGLNPSLETSLYGRGVAKLKKGDTDSGNSDIESAKKIEPDIADRFQRYGIQLTQLSQSPPGSRTSRAHRPRQQGDR